MYAQEATGLPQLLETAGQLMIAVVLPGDVSRLVDKIRKDRDYIMLFIKVFGVLSKGNLTK